MDFVLLGYSPELVKSIISASDGSVKKSEKEYEKSRKAHNNPDQKNLNQVCY